MALPRRLWAKAPLALVRHPAVLLGVVAASFLMATASASALLLRAGAESAALESRLRELTPLAAGLTIETNGSFSDDPAAADRRRRAAVVRLARTLPFVGAPLLTTTMYAEIPAPREEGNPLSVIPMARTNATAHVTRRAGAGGEGVWIPPWVAKFAHVKPGDALTFRSTNYPLGDTHVAHARVAAEYKRLDDDLFNEYWVNFGERLFTRNPDSPPFPPFVLMSDDAFYRLGRQLRMPVYQNTYELPVRGAMTPARARHIARELAAVQRKLSRDTRLARSIGCARSKTGPCTFRTSLTSAQAVAARSVEALTPVISLLAAFAGAIAIGAAVVAGAFGVRRRDAEARLSVVGGEARALFGGRTALEVTLPVLAGAATGFLFSTLLVRLFTPDGTVDRAVVWRALGASALAAVAAVGAVTLGAVAARGPTVRRTARRRRIRSLPWEVVPLALAAIVLVVIARGGGLVENATTGAHPRLYVLCLPLLVAAAATGLAARGAQRLLAHRRPSRDVVYLALRRLAAARALVVLLTVTAGVSFAALTFAEVLSESLSKDSVTKAYVANGSDVQALVDPLADLPRSFPYPITRVVEGFDVAGLDNGKPVDLLAIDPATMPDVVRSDALGALRESDAALPAIANSAAAGTRSIWIAGKRIPVHVVATVRSFPGMIAGDALLILSEAKLERAVDAAGAIDPLESSNAYVWARGDPTPVARALTHSPLEVSFVTTVHHFLDNAELGTAARTYGFLRVVGFGAAAVAVIALLLYLHTRARAQLVGGALLSRMGMTTARQAASVAAEAALLVGFAAVVGAGSALLTARPLVTRVDPLAQYAPASAVSVPWTLLVLSLACVIAIAAVAGALASALAARGNVGEALRVA